MYKEKTTNSYKHKSIEPLLGENFFVISFYKLFSSNVFQADKLFFSFNNGLLNIIFFDTLNKKIINFKNQYININKDKIIIKEKNIGTKGKSINIVINDQYIIPTFLFIHKNSYSQFCLNFEKLINTKKNTVNF